jgi:prepilin-type N-terminal cleavage/methylation domain-containing protein
MRQSLRPRGGFTLTELLVVIATATVLMSAAVTTLTLLMRAQQAGTAGMSSSLSLSRLAADFRRDVRAASAAETTPGANGQPNEILLSLAVDRRVVYRLDNTTIVRRETSSTGDDTIRNEAYAIDARSVRFDPPAAASGHSVTMHVTAGLHDQSPTRGRSVTASPRTFQFEATLGSDSRFER